jgi:chromosome segregation ATPase
MRTHSIVGTLLILAGGACAGSQADKVRDARMEQADARAEAETKTAENNGDARENAIEQRHENVSENIQATNPPGERAAQDMVQVSKERMQYQSEAKTKLDKLGARLSAAREKVAVLGGRAPTALKGELATAAQQYKMLENDVQTLDKTPASSWESTTEQVEKRMASLEDRVDDLTDRIEDV